MDRMNRRALSMIAVSCLVGSLWTLPALAQSSTTVERVGGAAEEIEKVSNEEKPEKSRRAIDKMRGALTKVIKYLEEAREQRDVLKLNCVNEKLTAIKGLLRVSEQADVAMQEAIATGELTAADHEYEKIMIASKKVQGLATESEVCIGELAVYSGQTSVSVEVGDEVVSTRSDAVTDGGQDPGARGGRGGSDESGPSTDEPTSEQSGNDFLDDVSTPGSTESTPDSGGDAGESDAAAGEDPPTESSEAPDPVDPEDTSSRPPDASASGSESDGEET